MTWQPGTSLAQLQERARLLSLTRDFFAQRQVLEVNTPLLNSGGSTDPFLDSFTTCLEGLAEPQRLYLQTSPEFFMKRLLAAGSGPIYQLGPCFRNGEHSWRHNPEFWMLEWYRPGWSLEELQEETCALVNQLLGTAEYQQLSYKQAFQEVVGLHPFAASLQELRKASHACSGIRAEDLDRDACLDLLISHQIEPALKQQGRVFLTDFPASQAALAAIQKDDEGFPVAQRFELYVQGIELANAYQELTSAEEQAERFVQDNQQRARLGRPQVTPDANLLLALQAGLPDTSGIALGFDRLVMLASGAESLDQVQAFSISRC
ncbi:lysyl-tRNA synthetase, class 2 [Marinospirillum celere]|uniref:Lysyl-tRNA synthetase, class 2 n=1 Tax=Marinospirillum celere TaxID=1122252 RepID=A0A1I1GUD7_9GAMM|nr:EF-P lysine aminoacylase EpmA [Marinospirillum celere]SFC13458.1 lysyl-tRNA synthetase, class 2 [Marinospirillum celere]